MRRHVICLVDCSNFYVSCEVAFQSGLQRRPAIVLSNGDGNIVASNDLAKRIGLLRGTPYFRCRDLIRQYGVTTYSSNYTLYNDMSDRIKQLLACYAEDHKGTPQLETNGIDEWFLSLAHVETEQLLDYGHGIREHILRAT